MKFKTLSLAAKIGVIVTAIWIIYIVAEVVVNFDGYKTLRLNELGDFLAGAGGPIALMWLVIGYFQQSAALRLQQTELGNQVAETKKLVEQAALQTGLMSDELNYIKTQRHQEAQPRFTMRHASSNSGRMQCRLKNHGATVSDVVIDGEKVVNGPNQFPIWESGKEGNIAFEKGPIAGTELIFFFDDAQGESQRLTYVISAAYTLNSEFADPE